MKIFFILLLLALPLAVLAKPPETNRVSDAVDIPAEAVNRASLRPTDIALLDHPDFKWKHLQTAHFILHHDQKIFAAKVARLGEQFYTAISADLPSLQDRVTPTRSHLFIFRDPRDWQTLLRQTPGIDSWAISFVHGNTLYLQEMGNATSEKMDLLAHEMTHLVFNRFLQIRLPLWLNEGLAEYYGEFAYRAARGMGQGRNNAFRPLKSWTPLTDLLNATDYPSNTADVSRFYVTSKYMVGFLILRFPREKWNLFFNRVLAGQPPLQTLLETYGWPTTEALEKDFSRFVR